MVKSFRATMALRHLVKIVPNDFGGGPVDCGLQQLHISEDGSQEWRSVEVVYDDSEYVSKWGEKPTPSMRMCSQLRRQA